MRRAIEHRLAGHWTVEETVSSVTLAFDDRYRRRIRLTDDTGAAFLLDLADTALLSEGDGLVLDGGGIIAVREAEEPVADIHCDSPAAAARIAWHIGNRHTPIQVLPDGAIRIRDDHVLVAMLEGLGARVERRKAPFSPERGAYDDGGGHHHEH